MTHTDKQTENTQCFGKPQKDQREEKPRNKSIEQSTLVEA